MPIRLYTRADRSRLLSGKIEDFGVFPPVIAGRGRQTNHENRLSDTFISLPGTTGSIIGKNPSNSGCPEPRDRTGPGKLFFVPMNTVIASNKSHLSRIIHCFSIFIIVGSSGGL